MKTYHEELKEMLGDCSYWDNESKALKEAFDKGIDFNKQETMQKINVLRQSIALMSYSEKDSYTCCSDILELIIKEFEVKNET